ncbi:hypothetical protein [uncultured Cedecea sp.]|uniref:hypothetical protein n=1 Tax=uncultured Cedecea sp. TaxID=988762 RepID=UPI002629EF33|nr:hypothetical protein [uncultured Cedecea sp.]
MTLRQIMQYIRIKWVGYLIVGVVSAGLTSLCLLTFILFYELSRTGSAADWIVSLASAAMAITAVFAFKVARSWLPQLTTQEGYKLAIELVNDHYFWLDVQNRILNDVELPVRYIRHQNDRTSMGESKITVDELIEKLELTVLLHKERRDKMQQIRFRLNTYGLRVTGAFDARFRALDTAYMHAADGAGSILQMLKETREQFKILPSTDSSLLSDQLVRDTYLPLATRSTEQYEFVSEQFNKMVESHASIFSSNPSIDKLFEIRR